MRILVVDDEELAVGSLVKILRKEQPDAEIVSYLRSDDAFQYLSCNPIDIAFLDIEMVGLSGLDLAKKCKELCPSINIVFVTGFSHYSLDALKLHVSGYLMKPVRAEDLRAELDNLRHPVSQVRQRIRIHTFGNFEAFVDDKPLKVPRTKCKECLAYLVDRQGASVSFAHLSSILWEDHPLDRSLQKSTHKVISDLLKALKNVEAEQLIVKSRTGIAIDVKQVECDYFSALRSEEGWMNSFTGEYMSNYSWAEFTLAELVEIKRRKTS